MMTEEELAQFAACRTMAAQLHTMLRVARATMAQMGAKPEDLEGFDAVLNDNEPAIRATGLGRVAEADMNRLNWLDSVPRKDLVKLLDAKLTIRQAIDKAKKK